MRVTCDDDHTENKIYIDDYDNNDMFEQIFIASITFLEHN